MYVCIYLFVWGRVRVRRHLCAYVCRHGMYVHEPNSRLKLVSDIVRLISYASWFLHKLS